MYVYSTEDWGRAVHRRKDVLTGNANRIERTCYFHNLLGLILSLI